MSIRLTILILLFQLSINNATTAQEFIFEVRVNAPTLKIADPRTISTLEKSISEFYNNTKWSSDEYEIEEKIENEEWGVRSNTRKIERIKKGQHKYTEGRKTK